jgi:ribonuclease P protein component
MLAAAQRLRRRGDFTATVRTGRRAGRGTVVVHLVLPEEPARPDADHGVRAGFVVSKAVGGAVVRNVVKRRLRHLARERLDRLPPGSDLVIRALPSAAQADYGQLGADLEEALSMALRRRGRSDRR